MDTNNDKTNGDSTNSDKLSQDWLSAYLDRELSAAEREEAERRLAASPELRRELDQLKALSEQLRGLPRDPAPGDLVDRVLARISFSSHAPSATNHSAANGQLLARPAEQNHSGINGAVPSSVGDNRAVLVQPANRNRSREWTLAAISLVVSAAALVMMVRLQNFEVNLVKEATSVNSSITAKEVERVEPENADRPRLVTLLAIQDVKAGIRVLERELDETDSTGAGQAAGQAFQLEFGVADVGRTVVLLDGLLEKNTVAAINQSPIEVHPLGFAADPLNELTVPDRERSFDQSAEKKHSDNREAQRNLSDSERASKAVADKTPTDKAPVPKPKAGNSQDDIEPKIGSPSSKGDLAKGGSATTFGTSKGVPPDDQMPQQSHEEGQQKVLAYYVEMPRETLMAVLNELKGNEDLLDVTVGELQVPDAGLDLGTKLGEAIADRPAAMGNSRALNEFDANFAQTDGASHFEKLTQNAVRYGLAFEVAQFSQQMPVIHPSDPAAESGPVAAPVLAEKGGQAQAIPTENRSKEFRRGASSQKPDFAKPDLAKSNPESDFAATPEPTKAQNAPRSAGAKPKSEQVDAKDESLNAVLQTQSERRAANGFQQKLSLSYRYENSNFGEGNSLPARKKGLAESEKNVPVVPDADRSGRLPASPPAARKQTWNVLTKESGGPVSALFDRQDVEGLELRSTQFDDSFGTKDSDPQGVGAVPGNSGMVRKPGASFTAGSPSLGEGAASPSAPPKWDRDRLRNESVSDAKKREEMLDRGNKPSAGLGGGNGRGGVDGSNRLRNGRTPQEPPGPAGTVPKQQRPAPQQSEEPTRYVRVLIVLRPGQSPRSANFSSPIQPAAPSPSEPAKKPEE